MDPKHSVIKRLPFNLFMPKGLANACKLHKSISNLGGHYYFTVISAVYKCKQ